MGDDTSPLSPQDRAKVFALVQTGNPELADRVALLLDDREDPIVRLLTSQRSEESKAQREGMQLLAKQMGDLASQMQRQTLVVVFVSIIAMCLNAGLVGVAISFNSSWGNLTVNEAKKPSPDFSNPNLEP